MGVTGRHIVFDMSPDQLISPPQSGCHSVIHGITVGRDWIHRSDCGAPFKWTGS